LGIAVSRTGFLLLMDSIIFIFFYPSQVTFIAACKCLIYIEISRLAIFGFDAKPLISLKKIDLKLLMKPIS